VFLDGSETTGAAAATLTVQYGTTLSITVPFRVWVPTLPISLMVASSVLNLVPGWFRNNGTSCVQRYQRSIITATATLRRRSSSGLLRLLSARLLRVQ
jgi:hypothetical protein